MIRTYTYTAENPGKNLVVFGAIHGNEICGPAAIEQVRQGLESGILKLKAGSVTFVPICNPKAHSLVRRFVDQNLNRIFKPNPHPDCYEAQLANSLTPLVERADYVLDVHSFHTPGSSIVFQDYPGDERYAFAKVQDVAYLIKGFPDVYEDAGAPAYSVEKYAMDVGAVAVTVEAGYHFEPESIKNAKKAILNSMIYLGLIDGIIESTRPMHEVRMTQVVMKDAAGTFVQDFENITPVRAGEVILTYTDGRIYKAPRDGFLFMPNPDALIGQEWFYFAELIS